MKTLIKLINDIHRYGLEVDSVTSNGQNVNVFLAYRKDGALISSDIYLRKYDDTTLLDWYRTEQEHKNKEGWNSLNYNLENSFNYFLGLIKRLKTEKGITEEQITNKLDLLIIDKRKIRFEYSNYDNLETIEFYITGATEELWKEINSKNYLRLIKWIIKGH